MNTIPSTRPCPSADIAAPRALFKRRIAAKFGRAVNAYETTATAQMEILDYAAVIMREGIGTNELWCDIGSGGGMLADSLAPLPDGMRIVCLDIAEPGLRLAVAADRTDAAVCGDIDLPPFKRDTFDVAAALSMLQWSAAPKTALRNIAQMLKPDGRFYFSVFVEGSFAEVATLRKRMKLEDAVWLPTASEFFSMLDGAGFDAAEDRAFFFDKTLWFPNARAAIRSLSGIGATASGGRLLNRRELDTLLNDYTIMFSDNGKVPLTYRAVMGKAVKK